jgi:hypothetical protein
MKPLALLLLLSVLLGCGGTPARKIELANFKKIASGMSAAEVTKLMGPAARTEDNGQSATGQRQTIWHWTGDDGIQYRAWFAGDTVGITQWQAPTQRP